MGDLNWIERFIRIGVARLMGRKVGAPSDAEHTMKYRRPLRVLHAYEVTMDVTHANDHAFSMTSTLRSGDRVVAEGTSAGVVRSREGVAPPA